MACNSKGIVKPIVFNDFEEGQGIDITVANPAVISVDIDSLTETSTVEDDDDFVISRGGVLFKITAETLNTYIVTKSTTQKGLTFADSPYSILLTDDIIYVDCTNGVVVTRLPPLVSTRRLPYFITKIDSSSNDVQVQGDGSELVGGLNMQAIGMQYNTLITQNRFGLEWIIF